MDSIVLMGLAAATLSTTLGKSKLFAPLRERVYYVTFLGPLVRCPYCLGHWFSAILMCAYASQAEVTCLSAVIGWLAVSCLSGMASGVLCWALSVMDH